jgi:hypothetical protein
MRNVSVFTRCDSANQKRPSACTSARMRISDFLSADVSAKPPGPATTDAGSPGPPDATGVSRALSGSAPFDGVPGDAAASVPADVGAGPEVVGTAGSPAEVAELAAAGGACGGSSARATPPKTSNEQIEDVNVVAIFIAGALIT